MEQFFHRLHVRRESAKKEGMSKKEMWRSDEDNVRYGSCDFPIKYLGYTEVHDSKGTEVCRQSFQKLKYNQHEATSLANIFSKNRRKSSTSTHQYAVLHISGDGIRIVDENEDILVETPISNISFCCPNSTHQRGFAFICKGNAPWIWHCHALEAIDDHGERLNHAVGCAFTVCWERKMLAKRRDSSNRAGELIDASGTTSASAAFRQMPISDRQLDPQASIVAEPVPRRSGDGETFPAIDRPKAPQEFKDRQGSLGGIVNAHPYKRLGTEERDAEEAVELYPGGGLREQ